MATREEWRWDSKIKSSLVVRLNHLYHCYYIYSSITTLIQLIARLRQQVKSKISPRCCYTTRRFLCRSCICCGWFLFAYLPANSHYSKALHASQEVDGTSMTSDRHTAKLTHTDRYRRRMTPPRWPLIGFSRRGRPAGAPREGSNRKSRSLTVADAASIDQLSGRSDRYNIGLMGGRALARFMAVAELLLLMVTLLLMKNDEAALHRAHTHTHT